MEPSRLLPPPQNAKVLAFRLPIYPTEHGNAVPDVDANIAEKLQWLALNEPSAIRMINEHLECVLRRLRPPPIKAHSAMTINLTSQMEYRALGIFDPGVLLAPPENRLGRKIHDVMPSDLMDVFDRCLYRAQRTERPSAYTFPVRDRIYKGTISVPSVDTVLVNVSKVLCAAVASCEVFCAMAGVV
jgi:hypothetical protein